MEIITQGVVLVFCGFVLGVRSQCTYNFSGPADVTFLLDTSGSIDTNSFASLKAFMKRLITRTMLIGPGAESNYVRLAAFKFSNDKVERAVDLLSNQLPVFESEFFYPKLGLFDLRISKDEIASDTTYPNGMLESIKQTTALFEQNSPGGLEVRRQIVILATDAEFRDEASDPQLSSVEDSIRNMRLIMSNRGASLDMYGIGVGSYLKPANLKTLVQTGNGGQADGCHSRNLSEWDSSIRNLNVLPEKRNDFGPHRIIYDSKICCELCFTEGPELKDLPSNCTIREFDSTDHRTSLLCDEASSREGICGLDVSTASPTTLSRSTEKDDMDEDEDGDADMGISALGGGAFSVLMIVFIIVNLTLIVMFLLVCIYAKKIGPPKRPNARGESQANRKRERKNRNAVSNPDVEAQGSPANVLTPSRVAPPPPTFSRFGHKKSIEPPSRPPPQLHLEPEIKDSDSGIVNEGYGDENIYGNQMVEDILTAHDRSIVISNVMDDDFSDTEPAYDDTDNQEDEQATGDRESRTYFDIFRHDLKQEMGKMKNRISQHFTGRFENVATAGSTPQSTLTRESERPTVVTRPRHGLNRLSRQSVLSPFKKLMERRNRPSESYENSHVIQDLHDQANKRTETSFGGMDNELQRKLAARRQKESEVIEETAVDVDPDQDLEYENEDVINDLRRDPIYSNVQY